jgi:RNA polymerase sigma-70 factor (ECF subfamily)
MENLEDIIAGCRKGKRRAQDALYKRYNGLLYGVCLRYTKSQQEAEDILQETFVKIYRHIGKYSMEKSFEGWIRRIAINTAITTYRKQLKHAYQEDITDPAFAKYDVDDHGDCDYTREELLSCIQALPDGYRTVFNMYVVEGYKHKEIAEMLDIDINTSKSQLSRAKKYLQRELIQLSQVHATTR